MAIVQTANNAQPGLKLAGLLLLLAIAPAAGRAQSSPAISIVLSPGHMVPQETAITATVTLENLDPGSYSSLVFRADLTEWDQHYPASTSCEGEDTGEDIPVEVNSSRETFTVEVWKSCSLYIYSHYTLDAALFRLDSSTSGGKVELASAETRFAMSRYLEAGEIPPSAPAPGVAGWLEPDPTSFEWKVGEWVVFRTRTDILQYLNSHVGVRGGGWPDGAIADYSYGLDVEEVCRNDDGNVNWRRAINQAVTFVACQAGEATMEVWHETEAERLSTYHFSISPAGGGGTTPGVRISTTALTVNEGGSGTYTVELASQPTGEVTVTPSVTGDEGVNVSGTLTFTSLNWNTAQTVTVSADDDADTADEMATVSHAVAGANYGSVTAASVDVTVTDNDSPVLTVTGESKEESNGPLTFTLRLSARRGYDIELTYATADVTAAAGADYVSVAASGVTIKAGTLATTLAVQMKEDPRDEEDETFELTVAAVDAANIGSGSVLTAVGTILDDDAAPVLTVTGERREEANGPLTFTLRLSARSGRDIELTYATADVTAAAGADYEGLAAGSVTIEAGTRVTTLAVQMKEDPRDEEDETFELTVAPMDAAKIGAGSDLTAVGTILDDDAAPVLTVTGERREEANGPLTFTLRLDAVSGRDIELTYATADVTATAGADYEGVAAGSVTIEAGTRIATLAVQMKEDPRDEEDETFELTVAPMDAAKIGAGSDLTAMGTILDDDAAPVLTIAAAAAVTEGQNASFVVTLRPASGRDIVLTYDTGGEDDTATGEEDYVAVAQKELTIVAAETEVLIQVVTNDDALDEEEETFELTAAPVNAAEIGSGSVLTAVGTILDNDDPLVLTIEDSPLVTEGEDAVFAVKLSVASAIEVTVPYATSDATATAGQDYEAAVDGSLVIPAGKTDTTIVVGTTDDALDEEDTETFTLRLQNPVGAELAVGGAEGTGTIEDNDEAPVLTIEDAPLVTEGEDAVFAVKLNVASALEVTMPYATSDATATAGQDYEAAVGGSLMIPAGKTDTTIVVGTTDDVLSEETETFTLTLQDPVGAYLAVGGAVGTGTILDNDEVPTVSVEDAPPVTEGEDAVFAVKLSVASALEVTVPYATSDATATTGQDYEAAMGGSLVIPAGKTDTTIVVGTIDDALDEEDTETFTVVLSTPVNATLDADKDEGTGRVEDNDDAPTVSIADAPSVTEGVSAVFAVKLSVVSGREVRMPYATSDATATAGQDYEAAVGGSLVIPAGKTDTTIVVGTTEDVLSEETETFTLTLQDPVGADLAVGGAVGTGTILDNDEVPTVSVEDAPSVTEGVSAVFPVKLSVASGREVTVRYSTVDVTATGGQDYEAAVGGSLAIPAGKIDTTIVVKTTDDVFSEETETFVLTLQDPVGADLALGAAEGTGRVEDNDEAPTVSIADALLVTEGVSAVFAVKLSVASVEEVTVPYSTVDVTATGGQDYEAAVGGSLVIPAGKTDTTIVVETTDDALDEEDTETFTVRLQNPVGAELAVGGAEGTGTIEDNDEAPVLTIEDAPLVTEGEDAVFAVKLNVASALEVTVPYATSDATATAGQDYEAVVGGSLVIPAGKTDTTIVVETTDDALDEEDTETFTVVLRAPANATLDADKDEGTGTIEDNDEAPVLTIEDAPLVTEGEDAVFAVKLSVASALEVTVPYATSDASATTGQDYEAAVGGSLVIPAGKTDTTIVVGTIDDVLSEETETFTLTLQDPVGADLAVGGAVGTGTILDNDEVPTVSVEDAPSVTEGKDAVFAVKLSVASALEVTVPYATSDASATTGQDYEAAVGGSLVIPAGKTDTTIVVGTIDDELDEEDTETFTVVLRAPANATLDVDKGTGTIEDNDVAPTVSIEDAPSVMEGKNAVFAVKLNVASGREVTVPYETSDATATAGQDYEAAVGGSLVIPAGKTDTTIVVGTTDDAFSEETETFTLTLQDPVGADLAVGSEDATGTILDNDDAPTVSIEDAPSVTEGVDAVFAVKLNVASGREVTMVYATSDATATAGQDYEAAVGGSLVIPAGKTDTTIVVGTTDDAFSEETETFTLTLQDPVGADLAVGGEDATGTILDDDDAPTVSIEDAPSVTEGEDAVFAVRLSVASGREVTVPYATSDATATAGQDYEAAVGGSLVIPAGKTDTTIVVGTTDDLLSEETETFILMLQDPVGAELAVGAAVGTGTIEDNDEAPTVSMEDAPSVTEGGDAVFAVKLSEASGREVRVPYATSDATATAGQDYEAVVSGTLVIPVGRTDTTIVVGTSDDLLSEETETFTLTLQDPVGAELAVGGAEGTGTIEDNDEAPTVSIEDAPSVTEGEDAVFAVKLSEASGREVTVPV